MAFQIKDFASVVASMLNWMRSTQDKVTDFNTGSVARTMLEAPAIEIEELYLRMFIGLREAVPVSVYNTFGFDRLAAAKASVTLRFTTAVPAVSAIFIPSGTTVRVPGKTLTYVTIADATIPIGGTFIDILAAADTAGSIGNAGASTITELVTAVSGISTVTNPAPVINGRDEETDDDRLNRFRAYISSLARGTITAVLYGAKSAALKDNLGQTYEYVALANLVEPWLTTPTEPVGLVRVYIHNGASSTSTPLVDECQRVIDGYYLNDGTPVPGWKAAGVKVIVAAATDMPVNVAGTIHVSDGYVAADVLDEAEAAVRFYIQNLGVGASVIEAELIAIIKRDVPGVLNVWLTDPTADINFAANEKAVPGLIAFVDGTIEPV